MEMLSMGLVMLRKIKFCFVAVATVCVLAACALGDGRPPAVQYDLGPLKLENQGNLPVNIPVISTKVHAPDWMNENSMFYRLDYINDQQIRFYTESSWNTSPSRLFRNRLDACLVATGNAVADVKMSSSALVLRIYLEDFSQHFTSPSDSVSRIALRASLFKGHDLIAQKRFQKDVASQTADAQGGARAMAQNSDELIVEIMNWLAEMNRR